MDGWPEEDRPGILEKGDLRRILLALVILATLAVGEVGVFWVTLERRPEGCWYIRGEVVEARLPRQFEEF